MWDRLDGIVRVSATSQARVAVVGCGLVGSGLAWRLSRVAVRQFLFIDGDGFKVENVPRSIIPPRFVGVNKARALAHHLATEMPGVTATVVPRFVRQTTPARELVELLSDVTLLIVAVDNLRPQFRLNRAALAAGVPSLFPGLYAANGGEVFVGLGLGAACFECWARFRPADSQLRAVPAIGTASLAVEQATMHLGLGILDPASQFRAPLLGARGTQAPRQLYLVENFGARQGVLQDDRTQIAVPVQRRRNCPGCAAGHALQRELRRPTRRRAESSLQKAATVVRRRTTAPAPPPQPAPPPMSITTAPQTAPSTPDSPRADARKHRLASWALVVGLAAALTVVLSRSGTGSVENTPAVQRNDRALEPRQAARIAVVYLTRNGYQGSTQATEVTAGSIGTIRVHAPGAQTPTLTTTAGGMSPPRRREHGWWEWQYRAPTNLGAVTLKLTAVFPGQSYSASITPLGFAVVARTRP